MLKSTDANNFRRTLAGLCLIAAPLVGLAATVVAPPAALDIVASAPFEPAAGGAALPPARWLVMAADGW